VSVWKMAVVVMGSALTLAACGGGASTGTSNNNGCNQTGGSTTGTGTQVVKINPDPNTVGRFDPSTLNVKVGDSVEWDWTDNSAPHTVTADDGSFESCTQNAGFKFVVTFSKAGDVKYHCTIHAQMVADVNVG
jgi:plastocyanin